MSLAARPCLISMFCTIEQTTHLHVQAHATAPKPGGETYESVHAQAGIPVEQHKSRHVSQEQQCDLLSTHLRNVSVPNHLRELLDLPKELPVCVHRPVDV